VLWNVDTQAWEGRTYRRESPHDCIDRKLFEKEDDDEEHDAALSRYLSGRYTELV
jgi:hypothetical protein